MEGAPAEIYNECSYPIALWKQQYHSYHPKPEPGHRRNGKVARLSKPLRDKINAMLLDGVPYPQIIQNLEDDGKELNEENIGTWRAGGYQDWLRQQIRIEEQQAKFEMALDMARDNAGTTFQRVGRQIAAAQLCDLFLEFDPAIVSQALVGKPELYIRLINSLARLSEGETSSTYRQTQEAHLKTRLQQQLPQNAPKAIRKETLLEIAKQLRLLPPD